MQDTMAGRLFADVARVRLELDAAAVAQLGLDENEGTFFGSGRLIGLNLVLTARHVLESRAGVGLPDTGWEVRLVRDQVEPGRWSGEPLAAHVVWRSRGQLDLALLELVRAERHPMLARVRLGRYDSVGNLPHCWVAGFPRAAREDPLRARPYGFPAALRTAVPGGPYRLTAEVADAPKEQLDWRGVSGGCVLKWRSDVVWLLGTVQHVPKTFGAGALDVARLDAAWTDDQFARLLTDAGSLESTEVESLEQDLARAQGIQTLLLGLVTADAGGRAYAARRLGAFRPLAAEAVPALADALGDPAAEVRRAASSALGEIGPAAAGAIPALVAAFVDSEWSVVQEVIGAFGKLGPTTVPALVVAVNDPAKEVRRGAVCALARIGPAAADAVPALVAAFDVRDYASSTLFAYAFGEIGPAAADAAPALVALLGYGWGESRAAIKALGNIGASSVPALVAALGDQATKAHLRTAAAEALGEIGPAAAGAVPALVAALGDQAAKELAPAAAKALGKIGPVAMPALLSAFGDPAAEGFWRAAAAEALGAMGPAAVGAVPALVAALGDPDPAAEGLRLAAAEALGKLGPAAARAVQPLVAVLSDPAAGGRLRAASAKALGKLGPAAAEAVQALVAVLSDSAAEGRLRAASAGALGGIGPAAAAAKPVLLAALRERGWDGLIDGSAETFNAPLRKIDPENACLYKPFSFGG